MRLDIGFTGKPLGHEIRGIDLNQLDDATFRELDEAYKTYGVIVVRDQRMSPEQQIDFTRRFGRLLTYPLAEYLMDRHPEIFIVSNVVENGKPIGMKEAGAEWHTDMSFT